MQREKRKRVQNGNRSCKKHLGQKAPRLNGRRGTDVQISLRGGERVPSQGWPFETVDSLSPSLQQKKNDRTRFETRGLTMMEK